MWRIQQIWRQKFCTAKCLQSKLHQSQNQETRRAKPIRLTCVPSLATVALIWWPWPWMAVTVQHMFRSTLPQSTIIPNAVTLTLIVSEPHGNVLFLPLTRHCDLDLGWRSPYKPIFWSTLPQGTVVQNVMSVASIVSRKMVKVTFFYLWPWPFDLDLGWRSSY